MDCDTCEGHGEWVCTECGNAAALASGEPQAETCGKCGGIGYVICPACGGNGILEQ
ncbi:MAG: hypothetical protein M0Z53_13560 [Thermaerobacter sp.]|nr:hypothetical protein [Thermaerobacter sp.]